jgi:uncharacterized protein YceK
MKGTRRVLLGAAVLIPLSGCGTAFNLASGDPDNYGGVQRDLRFASDVTANGGLWPGRDSSGAGGGGKGEAVVALGILALYGADVGLSFIGDTVTLPLAAYLRNKHEAAAGHQTDAGTSADPTGGARSGPPTQAD